MLRFRLVIGRSRSTSLVNAYNTSGLNMRYSHEEIFLLRIASDATFMKPLNNGFFINPPTFVFHSVT
jgi:hypothetical protein